MPKKSERALPPVARDVACISRSQVRAANLFFLFGVLFLLVAGCSHDRNALRQSVQQYWEALALRDKVKAMRFVYPDDLNKFLDRTETPFRGWKLAGIESSAGDTARVTIELQRIFPDGTVRTVRAKETWLKTDQGWKVRILSFREHYDRTFRKLYESSAETQPLDPKVEVRPSRLVFHSIAPDQPAVLFIRNGLESPVDLMDLKIDAHRFEIVESPETVEKQAVGKIILRYRGQDREPNLQTELTFRLRRGEEIQEFIIPVIYNYVDDLSRWVVQQKSGKKTEK